MDKSFQSPLYGNVKSPYVNKSRISSANSLLSGRKTIHGLKKSSGSGRYSLSGRSNQSVQVIAHSENHIVENYGLPLPVLVNEALTFSERNVIVSINCSENSWAWAVCGRRLLVWQYKEAKSEAARLDSAKTPQRRVATGQCRELTLPHCDIGHKASLVTIFMPEGQQMASCLAVSPTGDVRYWPSIAHDGSSIDETGILEGQEFDEIINISPIGYCLVTTTCSLVLLQLQFQGGRQTIVHRAIKPPSGFFGGIGKKFASIIIGMNSHQEKENKLLKIRAESSGNSEWVISVLADRWIQRWLFTPYGNETFLFEDSDVIRKIRDAFHKKFWQNRDISEIEIWLLDLQVIDSGLVILASAVNLSHTPQMQYAIVTMADDNDSLTLCNFCHVKYNTFYSRELEQSCLNYKMILNKNMAYIYSEKIVITVTLNSVTENEVEKIEFNTQGDKLLFAATFHNIPLFFSRIHGLICVNPSDFDMGDAFNYSITSDVFSPTADTSIINQSILSPSLTNIGNLQLYELDPDEIYNLNKDMINQLKAAFIYQLKKNNTMSTMILEELFPDDININEVDSKFDQAVLKIAEDLAEDIPAADPRWEQQDLNQKHALGSSASLQIIQQLREKNLALLHFIEFLHSVKLWQKLGSVTYKGNVRSTCLILSDINEKIIASIALKCIHNNYIDVIDETINAVLTHRKEIPYGNLTHQDLFYVKVTKIHEFFKKLVEIIDLKMHEEQSTVELSKELIDVNIIILTLLKEVIKFRENKSNLFEIPEEKKNLFEYLPWTSMSGKNGLREILLQLVNISLKYGARATGEPELKQKLYVQIVDLIDYILDGKKNYLESVKDSDKYRVRWQQYESQRNDLIYPLVEDGQYEMAAKLAEKYHDFQSLIVICDRTKNQIRLDEYIERFSDTNFAQYAINWHVKQNKQSDLLERFKGNQKALKQILGDHPSFAWIQLVFNGEMAEASKILFLLAKTETELVARKKTMLTLAKLTALAAESDHRNHITDINSELFLIEFQYQLPDPLLAAFSYDVDNKIVLTAEEIINLYISEENEAATEFDFRKALELLHLVDEPLDVKHKIWCAAILRDSWTDYDMNSPSEDMQNMMFFKLVDLCFLMDGELNDFLPPVDEFLTSPQLDNLINEKSFQFLIKLGYEQIYNSNNQ